jgi:hypothetical protein
MDGSVLPSGVPESIIEEFRVGYGCVYTGRDGDACGDRSRQLI